MEEHEYFALETRTRTLISELISPVIKQQKEMEKRISVLEDDSSRTTGRVEELLTASNRNLKKIKSMENLEEKVKEIIQTKSLAVSNLDYKVNGLKLLIKAQTYDIDCLTSKTDLLSKGVSNMELDVQVRDLDYTNFKEGISSQIKEIAEFLSTNFKNYDEKLEDAHNYIAKLEKLQENFNLEMLPTVLSDLEQAKRAIEKCKNDIEQLSNSKANLTLIEEMKSNRKTDLFTIEKCNYHYKNLQSKFGEFVKALPTFLRVGMSNMLTEVLDYNSLKSFAEKEEEVFNSLEEFYTEKVIKEELKDYIEDVRKQLKANLNEKLIKKRKLMQKTWQENYYKQNVPTTTREEPARTYNIFTIQNPPLIPNQNFLSDMSKENWREKMRKKQDQHLLDSIEKEKKDSEERKQEIYEKTERDDAYNKPIEKADIILPEFIPIKKQNIDKNELYDDGKAQCYGKEILQINNQTESEGKSIDELDENFIENSEKKEIINPDRNTIHRTETDRIDRKKADTIYRQKTDFNENIKKKDKHKIDRSNRRRFESTEKDELQHLRIEKLKLPETSEDLNTVKDKDKSLSPQKNRVRKFQTTTKHTSVQESKSIDIIPYLEHLKKEHSEARSLKIDKSSNKSYEITESISRAQLENSEDLVNINRSLSMNAQSEISEQLQTKNHKLQETINTLKQSIQIVSDRVDNNHTIIINYLESTNHRNQEKLSQFQQSMVTNFKLLEDEYRIQSNQRSHEKNDLRSIIREVKQEVKGFDIFINSTSQKIGRLFQIVRFLTMLTDDSDRLPTPSIHRGLPMLSENNTKKNIRAKLDVLVRNDDFANKRTKSTERVKHTSRIRLEKKLEMSSPKGSKNYIIS